LKRSFVRQMKIQQFETWIQMLGHQSLDACSLNQ
jgi:hypothetical protein